MTGALQRIIRPAVRCDCSKRLGALFGSAYSGVLCQPFVADGNYSEITSALTVGGLVGYNLSLLSEFLKCFRVPVHLA